MYYVYILASKQNKVLYTGVTNNLERRLYEHKNKQGSGLTRRYNVCKLVYFDSTDDATDGLTPYNVHKFRVRKNDKMTLKEGTRDGKSKLYYRANHC